MSSDVEVRVVTDPSEGPKAFRIQTRVTSRGEMAVILMGVDCAERVMCHESVGFDLAEGEFVFKVRESHKREKKKGRIEKHTQTERASRWTRCGLSGARARAHVCVCVCVHEHSDFI